MKRYIVYFNADFIRFVESEFCRIDEINKLYIFFNKKEDIDIVVALVPLSYSVFT